MPNTKRISITTDTSEIFIVRAKGKNAIRGFCFECAAESEMLTLDETVSLSGIATLEIVKQIGEKQIHFLETASGHLLICRKSLEGCSLNAIERRKV